MFGTILFGSIRTCKNLGLKGTLFYTSQDSAKDGACVSDAVVDAEENIDTDGGNPTENDETCLCEQDPEQKPGKCYIFLDPAKNDRYHSRARDKRWKCTESQVPS